MVSGTLYSDNSKKGNGLKKLPIFIVVFLLVGGGIFWSIYNQKSEHPEEQSKQSSTINKKDACDILDEATAKSLLGDSATPADPSTSANASSDDIVVSQCTYSEPFVVGGSNAQKSVSLLARSPKTETGEKANNAVFVEGAMPATATVVTGFGDKAFWNPDYGQLNILKANTWYILEYGPAVPSNRNLQDTKKFGDVLVDRL